MVVSSTLALIFSFQQSSQAADPAAGYPEGQPAPGRTCPETAESTEITSPFNGKILACLVIGGVKKWWIKGEPFPTANQAPTPNGNIPDPGASEEPFVLKHTYFLSKKSLSTMKIFEDVKYGDISVSQRLDIYLPKFSKKPPLMIWTHGGGFVVGDENWMKYDDSAKLLEAFIKNGIAVASINYRLSQEAKFPAAGQDAKRAIRFLRTNSSKFGYNPDKFITGGDSAGSYLALMAAFTGNQLSVFDSPDDPNLNVSAEISAVFNLFGNTNYDTMAANKVKYPCTNKSDPAYGQDSYVNPWFGDIRAPENRAAVESSNLYPYLKKLKTIPKVLTFHGTADCSVSKYDSIELDRVVKSLKGKSSLFLIEGADHGNTKIWAKVIKEIPAFAKS